MLIEANKSIPDNIRKKTLRWFKKDIQMTPDGLFEKLWWKHKSYWSNYVGWSKTFAKYEGYMRMAEAYGISEQKFIQKMEEFIKEDLWINESLPTVAIAKATLKKHYGLDDDSSDEELAAKLIIEKYHSQ